MAQAQFNLSNFIATARTTSFARTNRFEVFILPPPIFSNEQARLVSLYTEQINFPPIIINLKTNKIWGPSIHRPQSIEYGGEGITATFHIDRDMTIKKFFDDWMHRIVDKDNFTVNYQDEYSTTIFIRQLDEQNNVTYAIKLEQAFPRSFNIVELNNMSTNQTHRLAVTFAYRYWSEETSTRATDIPASLVNPDKPTIDYRTPTFKTKVEPTSRKWDWSTGELNENSQGSDLPPSA